MSGLLAKLTGSGNSDKSNDSHSAGSSSSHSSTTSNSSSSQTSATHGSTTSGTYTSGAAGATHPGLTTTAPGASATQHTTATTTTTTGYNTNTANTGAAYNTGVATAGANTNTDDAITRSEEQLRVGKEVMAAGTARLDKYVTTEHVQTSVPVTKERVVIEREPITEANRGAALSGPEISEAHHEVHLTEERAIAAKEVVPIERIRLGKQVETHEQVVGADLRKEHVDLTTTGINEKFDNVGYGRTTGTTETTTTNTTTSNAGKI